MASHANHNHPATPAARAACRKSMAAGDFSKAGGFAKPPVTIVVIPSSECDLHVPHCEMCGTTNPEDDGEGYTTCCNEPIVYQPCGHDHS